MARTLNFKIFRYNPQDPESKPHMQDFSLEETDSMTLFIALNMIREKHDPSLQFEFCCRAAICGACAMLINGRPTLACRTQTKDLPTAITLMPLPFFNLVADLTVDTGVWFREMNENVKSWVHTDKEFDPDNQKDRMDNKVANDIYELDRCIECGCCIAGCGTARMRDDFLGAAAFNRIARFAVDPRDQRTNRDFYQLVGSDEGVFGCMGLLACEDMCPKEIPLQDQLGILRRKMAMTALGNLFGRKK